MMAGMRIRIDAVELPGRTCAAPADGNVPAYTHIHVAVQRRDTRTWSGRPAWSAASATELALRRPVPGRIALRRPGSRALKPA